MRYLSHHRRRKVSRSGSGRERITCMGLRRKITVSSVLELFFIESPLPDFCFCCRTCSDHPILHPQTFLHKISGNTLRRIAMIVTVAAQINLIMLFSELFKEFYAPTHYSQSAIYLFSTWMGKGWDWWYRALSQAPGLDREICSQLDRDHHYSERLGNGGFRLYVTYQRAIVIEVWELQYQQRSWETLKFVWEDYFFISDKISSAEKSLPS